MRWLLALILLQNGEDLHEAARQGDLVRARALIEQGVDVDAGNRYGATALFFAAEKGDLDIVTLLVEHGARLDIEDSFYNMSALSRALSGEHFDVARFLLSRGSPGADAVLRVGVANEDNALVEAALATGDVTRPAYDRALEIAAAGVRALLEAAQVPEGAPPAPVELSREALERFTGGYENESEHRSLTIALRDGTLEVSGDFSARLRPTGEQSFEVIDSDAKVFFAGRGGMIERLVLGQGETSTTFRPLAEAEARGEAAPVDMPNVVSSTDVAQVARAPAAPWPGFRGPNRSGIADGQGIPMEWDEEAGKHIRFKTELPGFSVSSPVIWGERIFVLTAVSGAGNDTFRTGLYGDVRPVEDLSEHRWLLYALNTKDGAIAWERELHKGEPGTKRHQKSSQANATPVTNGKHVVTVLGSVGLLLCHDVDGNLLWKKDIGVLNAGWFFDPDYQWGHSSSPIIYGDTVILQADLHNGSFLAAYDLDSGEEVWRTPRDEVIPTFSTPAVYHSEKGDELITNGTVIRGYDPKTGELLWFLGPNSEIPIGVPVVTDELIYVTAGYPPIRPIYAIRPGSRGNLALPDGVDKSEALAWSKNRGGTYIPSPLVYRGHFYTNANNGRLTCYDAATGERVYRARIGGVGGSYAASPVAADGRLYFTNEEGETFVVRAGDEYELLAKNSVDGTVLSTPAASNGLLVIRTLTHVYGISE